jgi:hypothetical protein
MPGMRRTCSALHGYVQTPRVVDIPFLRAYTSSNGISPTKLSFQTTGTHSLVVKIKVEITHRSTASDWNTRNEFFKFTRGRFILDENENLRKRGVVFDMNELAKVAADSVGAANCVDVRKFTDGMFNKSFLMLMDDGQEVVAKVPNPNAGRAHYTTASEVATMDFVSVLELMSVEFGLT